MFEGTLREFQAEAVDFMLERRQALIAHPVGAGKTPEAIAAVEALIDTGKAKSILVICPASVKWQWARQIAKFTDGALVTVVEGNKLERQGKYRDLMKGKVEYLLVNYEQVVSDWDIIRYLKFDVLIADEVQYCKNPRAKRSRAVKRLQAKYKFGLTGQPIENRPEELFSIMQFIDPEVLGRFDIFDRTFIVRNGFGGVRSYKNLPLLRKTIAAAMHRRTREEIIDQLPRVVEQDYLVDMDPKGKRLYQIIARELMYAIRDAGPSFMTFNVERHYKGDDKDASGYAEIMPRLMALRMLCNHPELLKISASNFDDPYSVLGSQYAADLKQRGLLDGVTAAPKFTATLELIEELLEEPNTKVVLFSFFKPMLRLFSQKMKVPHVVFTGDLTARERDTAIEDFKNKPECRVFLSSDAGGVGVDLPVANHLISFDLPWSSGKWEQRNGRIIRLSSEWEHVTLIAMLIRGSIEERMLDMLQQKAKVAGAWLDGVGVDQKGRFELTLGSLFDFLSQTSL